MADQEEVSTVEDTDVESSDEEESVDLAAEKNKRLLNQFHNEKQTQERGSESDRSKLEDRLRNLMSINPKINPHKRSKQQEEISNLTYEQLTYAVKSAEDQCGLRHPYSFAKSTVAVIDHFTGKYLGWNINPGIKNDPTFLAAVDRLVPTKFQSYADYLNVFELILSDPTTRVNLVPQQVVQQIMENPQPLPIPAAVQAEQKDK
jgi:hypothetical protein